MKILFDHQIFTQQARGGASRYFYEVYKRLNKYENVDVKCSVLFSVNEYLNQEENAPLLVDPSGFPGKSKTISAINLLASQYSLFKNGFDVFHPTYYRPYYINRRTNKPIVVTCLDMIHEKFVRKDRKTIEDKRRVLTKATKVIAISQSTKNDMIDYYKMSEDKIVVSHLASSLDLSNKGHVKTVPDRDYILFVGNRGGYKNFIFFIEAIATLLSRGSNLDLYCVGGGKFLNDELDLFKRLRIDANIYQMTTSDSRLSELYTSAVAFFFPSLYEGFGLPVLEAMQCGCPVVVSNTSSLPEVGGNAALYFDPHDSESIYNAAETILKNVKLRENLAERGYERVKSFSWDKTANQHYKVYQNLL